MSSLVSSIVEKVMVNVPPVYEWPVKFMLAMSGITYVLSVITGNVSQVDRVWTFLPTIYTAYFALLPLLPQTPAFSLFPYVPKEAGYKAVADFSPRALLMLSLAVIWMFRLSYNTYRRGLFKFSDEDYRWAVLRNQLPVWLFQVVNLTFISFIQNVILFLLGVPTEIAASQPHTALSPSDYALGALALLSLLIEFTADNQQYSFQNYKHSGVVSPTEWPGARIQWTPEDAKRGFVTRGLWAWSRHPNFLCEQTFWIIITLFPLVSPDSPSPLSFSLHPRIQAITSLWPLSPALVLCALFFSSTLYTEAISRSKYPEAYAAYQQRVGMFNPVTTVLWGWLLQIQGKKAEIDRIVYGTGVGKTQKEE